MEWDTNGKGRQSFYTSKLDVFRWFHGKLRSGHGTTSQRERRDPVRRAGDQRSSPEGEPSCVDTPGPLPGDKATGVSLAYRHGYPIDSKFGSFLLFSDASSGKY